MDNATHFLTIVQQPQGKHYLVENEYWYIDETQSISIQRTALDRITNLPDEEIFFNPLTMKFIEFVGRADTFTDHPGVTFLDDDFLNDKMRAYIFDDEIFE